MMSGMKTQLIILVCCFSLNATTQNSDSLRSVFQKGDSTTISRYLRESTEVDLSISHQAEKKNDTLSAIDKIVSLLALTYLKNDLEGLSGYRQYTDKNLFVFLQPEIEIAIDPEFDFQKIFSGQYLPPWNYEDTLPRTQGKLSGYVSYYSHVPHLKQLGSHNYYLTRTDKWIRSHQEFDRLIKIDTLHLKAIEDEINKDIHRPNMDEIKKVIYTTSSRNKKKVYLNYNFLIDQIIFNPALDQAVVQFSTFKSSYEYYFFKVNEYEKPWELAIKRERRHCDYVTF